MRTLIVKLGALGDVILATSLIRQIQLSSPDDEIYLLTVPAYSGLFEHWAGINVTTFERKGVAAMWRAIRWIRAQRFDRVFDFQSNDRSGILIALSGIKQRIGNHPRFPYTHYPSAYYSSESHIFNRMNLVLESAGIPSAEPIPYLPASEEDKNKVSDWLVGQNISDKGFVVMHAGSSHRWPSKRWPYFQQLAIALEAEGLRAVWVGANDDIDLNEGLATEVGVNATNLFSVMQLAELGRHAAFAVTNDSGPMHILSASAIPVFSFFGPTRSVKNHALGQGSRVLKHDVECAPCSLGECPPNRGHICLRGISVAEVMQKLDSENLLKKKVKM